MCVHTYSHVCVFIQKVLSFFVCRFAYKCICRSIHTCTYTDGGRRMRMHVHRYRRTRTRKHTATHIHINDTRTHKGTFTHKTQYTCMHTRTHARMHMQAHKRGHAHTYTRLLAHKRMHTFAHLHIHMHACICMNTHTVARAHTCMHTFAHLHIKHKTHTHSLAYTRPNASPHHHPHVQQRKEYKDVHFGAGCHFFHTPSQPHAAKAQSVCSRVENSAI